MGFQQCHPGQQHCLQGCHVLSTISTSIMVIRSHLWCWLTVWVWRYDLGWGRWGVVFTELFSNDLRLFQKTLPYLKVTEPTVSGQSKLIYFLYAKIFWFLVSELSFNEVLTNFKVEKFWICSTVMENMSATGGDITYQMTRPADEYANSVGSWSFFYQSVKYRWCWC